MTLFHNKRGIELSINFIVALILGVAMFAGGMVFLSKFFKSAETMRANLDSQTEKQIEKLLDTGSPVVIPISSKEIYRNKFGTFGVGVLAQFNAEYTVALSPGAAFTKDKKPITDWKMADWNIQPSENQKITLKKNEKGKFLIGMTVPSKAKAGTYMFKVEVTYHETSDTTGATKQYDNPLQIIVKVP